MPKFIIALEKVRNYTVEADNEKAAVDKAIERWMVDYCNEPDVKGVR